MKRFRAASQPAAADDGLAQHFLRLALAIHVGGVDEVDPAPKGDVDQGGDLVLAGASELGKLREVSMQ